MCILHIVNSVGIVLYVLALYRIKLLMAAISCFLYLKMTMKKLKGDACTYNVHLRVVYANSVNKDLGELQVKIDIKQDILARQWYSKDKMDESITEKWIYIVYTKCKQTIEIVGALNSHYNIYDVK